MRAFDARTGAQRWSWDPIPTSGDEAARAAGNRKSAQRTGAANAWSILSVDAGRGLVFVPTGSASPDFFGGERTGDNRYANSLVALRAETGELVWHRQLVHHDLWDYDVAGAADADRHRARRQIDSGGRAGDEDRHAVRVRSRDRRAGVRDRRASRAAVRRRRAKSTSPTQPFPATPPLVSHAADHAAGCLGTHVLRSRQVPRADRAVSLRRHLHAAEPAGHDPVAGLRRRRQLGQPRRSTASASS